MEFDVVVVGGGLAGASLAVALRRTRLKVAVVEAKAPARSEAWDSRIYAVSPSSQAFLEDIGVWQHFDRARLTPVSDMEVFGDAGGALRFSAYESGLGELCWIVESSLMQAELWESLKRQHNVTLLCPARTAATRFSESSGELTLEDGRRLRARLVVAADGAMSRVRDQAGIEAQFTSYEELGVVANFRCERPHRGVAYQWFSDRGTLAYLPLPGDMISIVWSAQKSFAEYLLALDVVSLSQEVAAGGGNILGCLELLTPATGFPLRMMRVDRAVRPRLALIGDAAHAIHPLSGHGINLGFQDAKALADRLATLPEWRDPGEIGFLRGYARARAEEPLLLQFSTHALNRLFSNRNPFLSLLRNRGMNLTGRLSVVKNALVRYAANGQF